jgi:hypothetical protein
MVTSDQALALAVTWVNKGNKAYDAYHASSEGRGAVLQGCAQMANALVELHKALLEKERREG